MFYQTLSSIFAFHWQLINTNFTTKVKCPTCVHTKWATEIILKDTKLLKNSVLFTGDPKFRCTNTSAIVNNKRHIITCEVYDVNGIYCTKIRWKREDTGEDYRPGRYININVACRAITNSKIETTLEILQVTAEYFKTPLSVIYNYSLFQTKEYQLSIPEGSEISWYF